MSKSSFPFRSMVNHWRAVSDNNRIIFGVLSSISLVSGQNSMSNLQFLIVVFLFLLSYSIILHPSPMNISLRKARARDIDAIVETTNLAFRADTFFKKKPFHNRFTREDVAKMILADNSMFVVAEVTLGDRDSQKTKNNTTTDDTADVITIHNNLLTKSTDVRPPAFSPLSLLCGSLYLHWELQDEVNKGDIVASTYREMKEVNGRLVASVAAVPSSADKHQQQVLQF